MSLPLRLERSPRSSRQRKTPAVSGGPPAERLTLVASIARRPDGTYRPRYRDENGKEHAKHFKRKVDAQRWLDEQTAAMVRGDYVDPKAGAVTFAAFYADWSARQVWAPRTVEAMNLAAGSVP